MKMIVDPDRIEELGRQLKNFSLDVEGMYRYVHDMVTKLVDAVDAKYHESYVRANTRALREALGRLRGNTETASRNLQDLSRYALESAQEYRARDSQLARLIAQSSIKFGLNFDMQKALSGIYRVTGVSTSIGSKFAVRNLNLKLGTGSVTALLAGGIIPTLINKLGTNNEQEKERQEAMAKLDEIIRLNQKIATGEIQPTGHIAVLLNKLLSEKESAIDKLIMYEEDEKLRELLKQVKEGVPGAWSEYKLKKLEEMLVRMGYVTEIPEEYKEQIEKLSIELVLSKNLETQVIYYNLEKLKSTYPTKGKGITKKDIDELIDEGKRLAGVITASIQNRTFVDTYSGRPSGYADWSYNILVSRKEIYECIEKYHIMDNKYGEKQIKALWLINNYANNEIIIGLNKGDPIILFFEGAGEYVGKLNVYEDESYYDPKGERVLMHSRGRFGAMAILVIDGRIEFLSPNASTLPDNPHQWYNHNNTVSTVKPGVYYIQSDYSGGGKHQRYVGFATGNNYGPSEGKGDEIDTYRLIGNEQGTGCDIHPGWENIEPGKQSSTGCITISTRDYIDFMKASGLSKGLPNPKSYKKSDQKIKGEPASLPQINGAMVIDRTLDDPSELIKMYRSKEAVDIIMGNKKE